MNASVIKIVAALIRDHVLPLASMGTAGNG
jgi:hypothetical protein